MSVHYELNGVTLHHGDCLDVLASLPDASVDSVVTDPPYGLEFMGKGWDAPWRESDVNADAGMSATGYTDGADRLPRPTFTGSTNPKCSRCKGTRRGRRDGTAKVAVCLCDDGGAFPNVRAVEMRAFGAWCEQWARECLRVLKPGGHVVAFGGTRTWHRLTVAIEDAGFEIRDSLAWCYASGFPKSLDVSKAIDKAAGVEFAAAPASGVGFMRKDGRDGWNVRRNRLSRSGQSTDDARRWEGWGTALKPAFEPIVLARKPIVGTVAANVLTHGTGALNVDGCRIASSAADKAAINAKHAGMDATTYQRKAGDSLNLSTNPMPLKAAEAHAGGRWPANLLLDEHQAAALDEMSGETTSRQQTGSRSGKDSGTFGAFAVQGEVTMGHDDRGGASRFFFVAKADGSERPRVDGIAHPTVKPLDLMRWLVRLITPPGGVVLEPFAGSGTTIEAAMLEGFDVIGIEREADYLPLIESRISRRRDPVRAVELAGDDPGLFDLLDEGGAA